MNFRKTFIVLAVLMTAQCVGCGGKLESSLSGTVTHEGKPLSHALLSFQYIGKGPAAYSITDENGYYFARTGGNVGLLPGTYQVALQPPKDTLVPEKFWSVQTSGLEYEVTEGRNKVDIDL